MRIYAANSVFIEVTRRCNMCCAHCLRGDAESIDIQEKYIDAFLDSFEKGAYISSLTFTGGEISLNIPAIRYTLKAVKERGIAVGSFYMVTNGKAVDKMADLAMASLEWWNYCDEKDEYLCGPTFTKVRLDCWRTTTCRRDGAKRSTLPIFVPNTIASCCRRAFFVPEKEIS